MKNIQQLTFILMKTFDLNIKNRIRIHINIIMFFNVFCKTQLILIFDIHKFLLCLRIICIFFKAFDKRKIRDPFICSNLFCNPGSKKRITVKKESSLCDSVCLIIELLRHHFIEIFKLTLFQDFCMKTCNTIDGKSCYNSHICHSYLTFIKHRHVANLAVVVRITFFNLNEESTIDFLNDLINSWEQTHK